MRSQFMLVGKEAAFMHQARLIEGTVVGESQSTFTVRTRLGEKTLLKNQITLLAGNARIAGAALARRPEERLKGR